MAAAIGREADPRWNASTPPRLGPLGPSGVRTARTLSGIASDLDQVAADLEDLYRSCRVDNAIPLLDALHAVQRAAVAVNEAGTVVDDGSYPELWIA